jgi:hypothetical protein
VDRPDDHVVVDRQRELAIEQHLDPVSARPRPDRCRPGRLLERRPRPRADNPVGRAALPFLEGDYGEPGLIPRHAVDTVWGEIAEIGEALLERSDIRLRRARGVRRRLRRRHDRLRRLLTGDRPRAGDPGEQAERYAPSDQHSHRLDPRACRRREDELRDPRAERFRVPAGREPLAEVDRRDAVRDPHRAQARAGWDERAELLRGFRLARAGKERRHGRAQRRSWTRDRDELLPLQKVDLRASRPAPGSRRYSREERRHADSDGRENR